MKPKLKPRNPLVADALFRKAGAHDKSGKARRQEAKQAFQRALKQGKEVFTEHGHKRIPGESVSAHAPAGQTLSGRTSCMRPPARTRTSTGSWPTSPTWWTPCTP